jgi:hypothetical protein
VWAGTLVIYAVARVATTVMIICLAPLQPDLSHDPAWHVEGAALADPGYWEVLTNWDGQWYKTIALHGYPLAGGGQEGGQNTLAFYPLYPLIVRAAMSVTGLRFEIVAPTLSLMAGAVAMVLLARWLERTRGKLVALGIVTVLSFFPSSPTLQMAYNDAVAMVLLVICLRAAIERRRVMLLVVGTLLSLTRPVLAPVAVFVLMYEWHRMRDNRSAGQQSGLSGVVVGVALAALSFLWPAIIWLMTGDLQAYFASAASWVRAGGLRGGWVGGVWALGMAPVAVALAGCLLALVLLRVRRGVWLGPEDHLGLWAGLYLLFILGTTTISTSIFRYALFALVPLGNVALHGRKRPHWIWWALIPIAVMLQWVWLRYAMIVDVSPAMSRPP